MCNRNELKLQTFYHIVGCCWAFSCIDGSIWKCPLDLLGNYRAGGSLYIVLMRLITLHLALSLSLGSSELSHADGN